MNKTMRIAASFALLWACLIGSARAEWQAIDRIGPFVTYVDPAKIQREGTKVRVWSLIDAKPDATTGFLPPHDKPRNSGAFRMVALSFVVSEAFVQEFDCKERMMRKISDICYSGQMGTGDVVSATSEPSQWVPVGTDALSNDVRRFVCTVDANKK